MLSSTFPRSRDARRDPERVHALAVRSHAAREVDGGTCPWPVRKMQTVVDPSVPGTLVGLALEMAAR
jgi:hypothetical protein